MNIIVSITYYLTNTFIMTCEYYSWELKIELGMVIHGALKTEVTRGWALDRVHNSRRPCGAVSLSGVTAQRDGAARLSRRDFLTQWPWPLTFWPSIHWWARYRDGPSLCQVWRLLFRPFWFDRANRHKHREREWEQRENQSVQCLQRRARSEASHNDTLIRSHLTLKTCASCCAHSVF